MIGAVKSLEEFLSEKVSLIDFFNLRILPKNYSTDFDESRNKYWWYYIGRHEGKKDYSSPEYFSKHEDAMDDAIRHYKLSKKLQ